MGSFLEVGEGIPSASLQGPASGHTGVGDNTHTSDNILRAVLRTWRTGRVGHRLDRIVGEIEPMHWVRWGYKASVGNTVLEWIRPAV